ncbi:mechanosensitive ion channel domain-containing protein [Striga asiatica]|uniref:Mechanosensitive ion channel protein n=1 Tax=Striga asiatica TaxID=4170 RepID=A0A5A7PRK0_STRAF|nr:mechanosensitive ion channel domain-containing protein [Striga asiatica]
MGAPKISTFFLILSLRFISQVYMDVSGAAPKQPRGAKMAENQKSSSDVVISMPEQEKDSNFTSPDPRKHQNHRLSCDSPSRQSAPLSCPSPEIANISPNPNKPPKIPKSEILTRRKSLSRSVYSKPRSRFGEQSTPIEGDTFENDALLENQTVCIRNSPDSKVDSDRTLLTSPKTPLISSPVHGPVDEDEKIYIKVSSRKKHKHRKVKAKVLIQWFLLLCVVGFLVISLTVDRLQNLRIWGLRAWRWCVLVLVTFSGLLFTDWFIHFVVLLIELNFLLKKKVLYFVYGLKKSVRVLIWLSLVLLTWVLLIREGVEGVVGRAARILDIITWTITSLLIGSSLWLLKTLLLKILASSFHVNTFFDRIQESTFHQYVLLTLSGIPIMKPTNLLGESSENAGEFSKVVNNKKEKKEKKNVIDINKLHRMKQEKVSAWTMKMLVDTISTSGLTTLSNAIDESVYGGKTNKWIKRLLTKRRQLQLLIIFFEMYIDELDLSIFMTREEVEVVFPMIDVAETGQIDRKTLTDWVVKVYKGRKALAHALTDTKTAVKQLNKLVSGILIIISIVIWLLLVGIATTKVLVFLSSQLVLAVFVFGNTCKTIFEAIIFVFVMHPFDVGDRCVIDGVQMIVEEMNILTTVFLRYDNEKIYYPNTVLATKPISNFYRSPDMGDSLEFSIDFKTPLEKIGALKYLENNPQHWHPNHSVVVKEIENVNKIKMALFINHTMNFQDFSEKSRRRTSLVLETKKIFEELDIRYELLPQEVRLVDSEK